MRPGAGEDQKAKARAAQRRAASPDRSVWVAASAGTGKTKVLTDRLLRLLLEGAEPARILALTFTRAAAAEMANRLAERLAGWATAEGKLLAEDLEELLGMPPAEGMLDKARQLFARVLDVPGGMKIMTIHAFCQSLLSRFPLEAGIAPNFQVLDERSALEILRDAREGVLAAARDDAILRATVGRVSIHIADQRFEVLLSELTRHRARLELYMEAHGGPQQLLKALDRALGLQPSDTEAKIVERFAAASRAGKAALERLVRALGAGGGANGRAAAATIETWLRLTSPSQNDFKDYAAAFLTQKLEPRQKVVNEGARAADPDVDELFAREAERIQVCHERLACREVADKTQALLTLAFAILERYGAIKRLRALLDYDDLVIEARRLLTRPGQAAWVLYKLDGGLDHLLVDEAQDTNPDQWAVVRALTDEFFAGEGAREVERSFFSVGDAKQSIYSFQRADPEEFMRVREEFAQRVRDAGKLWDQVALEVSFRSAQTVLRLVDAVFANPDAQDGVLFGEAAIRHEAMRLGRAGLVELWPQLKQEGKAEPEAWSPPPREPESATSPRSRLAGYIAARIRHWTDDSGPGEDTECFLASKGRRLRPGDILVLVRRRNAFVDELVRALKQQNVPVAGVDRMLLRDQLAVMDLVAFGRALLLPEDDLTLATVLKGPFIGLDEEELFELAYKRDGGLWAALNARAAHHPRFGQAAALLGHLLGKADYLRPFELYGELLGPLGGRARLLERMGAEAKDPLDEFMNLALLYEREHPPSLEGFLHWLDAGEQEVKREQELASDVVRVMTVHGAKGLQAPVVILPDTLPTSVPSDLPLFWLEAENLPLWARGEESPLLAKHKEERRRRRLAEERRLLYVALTRAEDRLYVCGYLQSGTPISGCWYDLVAAAMNELPEVERFDFAGALSPLQGWAGEGLRLSGPQTAKPEEDRVRSAMIQPLESLEPWMIEPAPPEPAPGRPLAPSRPSGIEPPVRSPLKTKEGDRFKRGLIIHRLLQSLPELPRGERRAAATRYLASPVHGLSKAEQKEMLDATFGVLENPEVAEIFGPESRAEVPVSGLVEMGGELRQVAAQIDRLLVTEERVAIVDYKTNRPAPQSETDVPVVYIDQLAAYRLLMARIHPEKAIDCMLLWTDGPRLMRIGPDTLARRAP